jgi:hypothetical protein
MQPTTRACFAASLLALIGAAALHTAVLFGLGSAWGAFVHLTIFGWISGMIFSVNYHTMPVFTGRDFPAAWPIWAHLAAFGLGATLAPAGMLADSKALIVGGLALELLAALLFALNIALLFARGRRRALPPAPAPVQGQREVDKVGTRATAAAGLSLPTALLLLLAGRTGALGGEWWLAAEHLATLGWILLMIVGVAYHVLPRFSGRATRGARWARRQLGLHLLSVALIVLALGFGQRPLFALGGLAMSLALALFAWVVWPTLRAVPAPSPLIQVGIKERTS